MSATRLALVSPTSRRSLRADTAHSLVDDAGERWPVVDGVAYLRTGRGALVVDVLDRLDAGDRASALVRLLADQDDWWTGPPADPERLRALVESGASPSLREAMAHLGFGRVGDYFAHRWSDPTFLAGLALIEASGGAPPRAFELACGAGHYLRELGRRGTACVGADVVFAKLWLARGWVAPDAEFVCFDAGSPWPIDGAFDLVLCADAFYFLEPKPAIADQLRALVAPDGRLAIPHVHNRDAANLSAGAAATAAELAALFPDAIVFDDAELTRALAGARAPDAQPWAALADVEAFSLIEGAGPVRASSGGLALPRDGASLVRNPLYATDGAVAWPSERYRAEYQPRATYPDRTEAPERAVMRPDVAAFARSRELVDLPERW